MQRREGERQAAARARSHTAFRQQLETSPAVPLTYHGLAAAGASVLAGVCEQLRGKFPHDVAMGLPAAQYLKLLSPSTYSVELPTCAPSRRCR